MKKILTAIAVVGMLMTGSVFAACTGGGIDNTQNGCGGPLDVQYGSRDSNTTNSNNKNSFNNDSSTTYNGRVGDTNVNNTRNVDRSVTNIDKSRDNYAAGGRGGRGGAGGDGGTGLGVGIGKGGDASANNRNLNAQGQMQGQVGIVSGGDQRNVLRDSGNSQAYGGNVYIGGGDGEGQGGGRTLSPTAKVGDVSSGSKSGALSLQGQSLDGNNSAARSASDANSLNEGNNTQVDASDNSTVIYEGDEAQKRNPVSTAYAAPLVTSNDTCMGSTSAGGQGITLGLSFATTWTDDDCIIRKDARFLHNAKHEAIALGLMCEKPAVRRAVARAGSVEKRRLCGLNDDGSEPAAPVAEKHVADID